MSAVLKKLEDEVLRLPARARVWLAERLLMSLDEEPGDPDAERSSATEIGRHAKGLTSGDTFKAITAVARVRSRQRELLWQLIEVQEEERKRIAGELHDRMGRRFFEFYYGARQCQEMLGDRDPETSAVLARLVEGARDCASEIRDLINELRPSVLDDFGFVEALKEHVTHLQANGEFEVSLRLDEAISQRLSPTANIALFRAFQEAIMNARKHSSARRLWIEFTEHPKGVFRLTVRDDGKGFDPGNARQGHLGLLYMKERIEACGGILRVYSAPGEGAEIQVELPIKQG